MSGVSSEGIAPSVGRYGWVTIRAFSRASITGAERFTDLPPSVDLSHHAHSHSIGCNTFLSDYQRYDPIQLQGARILHLLLMRP
jgi:hypothetical protein